MGVENPATTFVAEVAPLFPSAVASTREETNGRIVFVKPEEREDSRRAESRRGLLATVDAMAMVKSRGFIGGCREFDRTASTRAVHRSSCVE